jgi:hypothetical protein
MFPQLNYAESNGRMIVLLNFELCERKLSWTGSSSNYVNFGTVYLPFQRNGFPKKNSFKTFENLTHLGLPFSITTNLIQYLY